MIYIYALIHDEIILLNDYIYIYIWKQEVEPMKENGNTCFKSKKYADAIKAYTEAIHIQ